jgi:hypothetical protein
MLNKFCKMYFAFTDLDTTSSPFTTDIKNPYGIINGKVNDSYFSANTISLNQMRQQAVSQLRFKPCTLGRHYITAVGNIK